ncbi:MAG: putative bifunctional diguanylate cyclase/phosphodiesterase, partial [Alphaproteobacteria bacterium]
MTAPLKILVVDDDDVDRMTVRRSLQRSGLDFVLTEAVNGVEALKACETDKFDCVFLDYRLPDADGADIFRTMLADHDSEAAVVFLTGEEDEDLALQLMGLGAVDYLNKAEISPAILKRAVRYASARQSFHRQLVELGQKGTLTGLPNRSVLETVITKAVAQAKRSGTIVVVALLDLDHFKNINDTLGHPAGDKLLKITADRLLNVVRETDTVIRLGGDEFAVVSPNMHTAGDAAIQAEKMINALSNSFPIGDQELFVSTSIGIVLAPTDGGDTETLLKSADLALYKAKADGRGRYHFYDEEMHDAAQAHRSLENGIRQALADGEFELHYQPKVNISTGEVLGMESPIRWNRPGYGPVGPDQFIPVAEKCQLIVEIGAWVLQEACRQNVEWQKAGMPQLNCAVNLSPFELKDTRLIYSVDKALDLTGFDPSFLEMEMEMEMEITESAILDNLEGVTALLRQLRMRGVATSIDDFGTGYSSLTHLKHLPVDKLKIDRSFVSNILGQDGDAE